MSSMESAAGEGPDRQADLPPRPRRGRSWLILGMILLVAGPVLAVEFPHEVARWYLAAAEEQRLEGNPQKALQHLESAAGWDDRNLGLYAVRAQLLTQLKDYEAAAASLQKALELRPDSAALRASLSNAYLALGRNSEAVMQWDQIRALHDAKSVSGRRMSENELLNGHAYIRAVANAALDEALADSDKAVQAIYQIPVVRDPEGFLRLAAGCTYGYTLNNPQRGLEWINQAIPKATQVHQRERNQLIVRKSMGQVHGKGEERLRQLTLHLGRMLLQRAELSEKLELTEQAEKDRQNLEKLGIDAAAVGAWLGLPEALATAQELAMFLDTRGYVQYRRGEFETARGDLDEAVRVGTVVHQAYAWLTEIERNQVLDVRVLDERQLSIDQMLATVVYHRGLVLAALGNKDRAEDDFERVRELGHTPSDKLF